MRVRVRHAVEDRMVLHQPVKPVQVHIHSQHHQRKCHHQGQSPPWRRPHARELLPHSPRTRRQCQKQHSHCPQHKAQRQQPLHRQLQGRQTKQIEAQRPPKDRVSHLARTPRRMHRQRKRRPPGSHRPRTEKPHHHRQCQPSPPHHRLYRQPHRLPADHQALRLRQIKVMRPLQPGNCSVHQPKRQHPKANEKPNLPQRRRPENRAVPQRPEPQQVHPVRQQRSRKRQGHHKSDSQKNQRTATPSRRSQPVFRINRDWQPSSSFPTLRQDGFYILVLRPTHFVPPREALLFPPPCPGDGAQQSPSAESAHRAGPLI